MSYPGGSVGFVDGSLAVMDKAVEECLSVSLWARSPEELVEYLDRVQVVAQRVAALRLALVREVDARGVAVAQGAPSTLAWLRDRLRISGGEAKRCVSLARAMDQLPVLAEALACGAVNADQAQIVAATVERTPGSVKTDSEACLVGYADTFPPKELGRLAERILEHVAPEVAEGRDEAEVAAAENRAFGRRELHVSDVDGTSRVRIGGWLDREGAAHLRAALDPLMRPCPGEDGLDRRTPEQRRADALVEVCRLANACGELPDNGGDRPQVVVTMDLDRLTARRGAGRLDDGGNLSPESVRRLACDAGVVPAVLDGAGQVLDVGRERRLFTGALRRALVLRDQGCAFPACDRPPTWCQAHHAKHWIDGGSTDQDNGVLLCGYHHRLIHHSDWQVRIVDHHPEFTPPEYIDPGRKPIKGGQCRRR
jgi:Domain of unknown function (DUF222)